MSESTLKPFVRGTYDIQKLRIQAGNRVVANYKAKIGQEAGEDEETLPSEAKMILRLLRNTYKRITDGITGLPRQSSFKGDEVISSYTELCLISQYQDLIKNEETHFKLLEKALREHSIYTDFLKNIKGVGPAMAGVIVSEVNINECKYPSSLWKYAGLDVAADGQGRSKKKEHLVDTEYLDSDGKTQTKKGITFNPFLKTKLIGVLGPSFLRAGDNEYSRIYRNYKNRLINNPKHEEKSKGHINNMAIRYMVKMFLANLHIAWREIEGLPVSKSYHEEKLGHVHSASQMK